MDVSLLRRLSSACHRPMLRWVHTFASGGPLGDQRHAPLSGSRGLMLRQAHLVWGFVLVEEERLASCSLDAVASAMEQMAAVQMAALVGMLDLLGEYERREGWRVDSFGSMVDWVAARFSVGRETAAAWTATAGRLRELPRIHEVAAAGGLSWDQLRPLAELATPDTDAMWAEEGPGLSPA